MAHFFKKYTSNRGSALFMVVSTMTALLISCMAMYFSMVTSRNTQYAVFNKEQAYQSADSIAEIIQRCIADPDNTAGAALLDKITDDSFGVGDTITTGANDFKSLDPNNSALSEFDGSQLGAYSITITRLPDGLGSGGQPIKRFDICVISSVDGNRNAVHRDITYDTSTSMIDSSSAGASEIFTATGYVPNDAYLDGGYFLTNTFFDTEFSVAGMYNPKSNYLAGDLSTGGSFVMKKYMQSISGKEEFKALSKKSVWAIRGNFDIESNNPLEFMDGSMLIVGGNVTFNDNADFTIQQKDSSGNITSGGTIDIYILGNLNIKTTGNFTKANVYVNGNVNIVNNADFKNLYVNGTITGTSTVSGETKKWSAATSGMTKDEVIYDLESRTDTATYYKWKIEDDEVNSDNPIHIRMNNNNMPSSDEVPAFTNNFYIAYPGSDTANDTSIDPNQLKVGTGFTIDGFDGDVTTANNSTPLAVIIDTGNDENNIVKIRVKPYLDVDGDGTKETFAWKPYYNSYGLTNNPFAIIVKGRGSVIIDVPENCVYQDVDRGQTMHYSWFKILGGTEGDTTVNAQSLDGTWGEKTYHYYNAQNISGGNTVPDLGDPSKLVKPSLLSAELIHSDCASDECDCDYSFETSTKTCDNCGTALLNIVCDKHGKVGSYCPNTGCNSGKPMQYKVNKWQNASSSGEHAEGFCDSRLDKETVDQYLTEHPDIKEKISDSIGVIYPNVNIYMVSCSESTDIRFATDVSGRSVMENGFYGYIYAPYITYKGEGDSGSLCARFCGGLTVSDYIFNDSYPIIGCYPDRTPKEMAEIGGGKYEGSMNTKTTKTWKIDLEQYR